MIYSRLLFLYGPSLCLRRPPARPRRPPASSPRREARTGVCVLRARFLCIRLFIRFGTPPAAFRSAPSHRTRRLLPHGRGNGVRLFAPRLHTAQELYLCFFGSARPRAAFPRRRNKPAPPALSLRRRTAPRTGLRPRAGWLRLRAGCAHASRGLKARAPHGRRGAARRGVACGRVRPCGGSGRRLLLKTDRSMAACCTANGRHTGSMAAGPSGYRPRQICPPGKTDSARCWDKPECSGMLYCK